MELTVSIRSSFTASAANFRIPSESFSTAIWSSLCSQRKAFSSRCIFSKSLAWAGETPQASVPDLAPQAHSCPKALGLVYPPGKAPGPLQGTA